MHITVLRLAEFRLFDDREFRFSPGMNVIRGPNESGKSTVVRALVAALFEKPHADNVYTRSDLRWGAEEKPILELEFDHEGASYLLVKDFRLRTVVLEELGGSSRLTTTKAARARISEFLGFSDPAQFERTACVTHDQMMNISSDRPSARKLADLVREVVVGERESVAMEGALRTLAGEIDELKRGLERPARNPGTIARLQREREVMISRQKELTGGINELDSGRSRLKDVDRLLGEKERRLENLRELLNKNLKGIDLEKRMEESRRRFEFADRVKDAGTVLDRIEAEIERAYGGFLDLGIDAEVELLKEIEVRESLGVLARELEAEESPEEGKPSPSVPRWAGWIIVALGVVLVIGGATLWAVHAALLVLLAPGALILAAGAYLLLAGQEVPAGLNGVIGEQVARAEEEIAKLRAREKQFLGSVGCGSTKEFFTRFELYRDLVGERDNAAATAEALLGDRTMDEIKQERRNSSLEVSACDAELTEMEPYRVPPERLEEVTGELGELSREVEALSKEREGLEFHLGKTKTDPEETLQIEENLAWLWEAEQKARSRLRVTTLAYDAMKEVSRHLLSAAIPTMAEGVGRTLSVLTGGRYDTVEVRESDLAISVYSEQKGDMIPVEQVLSSLSKGTLSQLYLAARLELVDVITGGRRPPLIFDDSFSYFDDDRLERLWNVLLEVAKDQQVFLFTCCSRYDSLIGPDVNVIDLEPGA